MQTLQKSYSAKAADIKKQWWVIDATDLVLGRLAVEVSMILRGKNKPTFTPHMDCGDNIVIINAEKVHLTGNKYANKLFYWHTGFPGGIKSTTPQKTTERGHPERVIERAVRRMINRNPLGRKQMGNLYIYKGAEHPHAAQQPQVLDIAARNPKNKKRDSK